MPGSEDRYRCEQAKGAAPPLGCAFFLLGHAAALALQCFPDSGKLVMAGLVIFVQFLH
jgi:hypothetical protein